MGQEKSAMGIQVMLNEFGSIKYGDFILSSGKKANCYVDIKHALLNPPIRAIIVEELRKLVPPDVHVAGIGLGGTLLVASLPHAGLIIRERAKDYGTKLLIEGQKIFNDVVVVEDVITTGASVNKAIHLLRQEGFNVRSVLTVVKRTDVELEVPTYSILNTKNCPELKIW